jgi:hypothetical protein
MSRVLFVDVDTAASMASSSNWNLEYARNRLQDEKAANPAIAQQAGENRGQERTID